MKKVLLTGAALVAMAATPAMAEGLSLDVAGGFKGYGVYNNGSDRDVSIRKETEVHFTGETTLDSGLTVGVHIEANADADEDTDGTIMEESYMYMSGGWGRVNFGEEDGAGYLLQVAAPGADSNVDGLRQYITTSEAGQLDYDMALTGYSSKLTYMTPVFNGFQAGVSYTPTVTDETAIGTAATTDNTDEGYEAAARYEGAFEGVGVTLGAGYAEVDGTVDAWNTGVDLNFAGFGLGVAYMTSEDDSTSTETDTLVVGADYQMGAYTLGASWLNQDVDAATDVETDRYTAGASYSYGPGMSFRGSVSYIESDDQAFDEETQVMLGTQVNF